jgi:hypothetical protein
MDEKIIKVIAFALAEATPDHAGRSASPPQSWRMEGEEIVVLCADGRKVRGPIAQFVGADLRVRPSTQSNQEELQMSDQTHQVPHTSILVFAFLARQFYRSPNRQAD